MCWRGSGQEGVGFREDSSPAPLAAGGWIAFWGLFSVRKMSFSSLTLDPRPSQAQGEAAREPCGCYDYRASQQNLVPKKGKRALGSDEQREYTKRGNRQGIGGQRTVGRSVPHLLGLDREGGARHTHRLIPGCGMRPFMTLLSPQHLAHVSPGLT